MTPTLISLTFDDGLRCQFERAVPILDQYDFSATFFLTANTDPIHIDGFPHPDWAKTDWNHEDVRFLKDMIRRRHEIGAHSVHHRHPFLDNDPKGEAEGSKRWIEERLEVEVSSYCYPFCRFTEPIKQAVVTAGYKQARAGASRIYGPERTTDLYRVNCRLVALDNPISVQIDARSHQIGRDGSECVDGWVQPDWYVLMFHGIGTLDDGWWPISVAEFERQMSELARLRDSGEVEVLTFADGGTRLRTEGLGKTTLLIR
jgi:peptidoglycan/xylan/chitin deacetylase (PgdA/CDA1 family)